MVNPVWNLISSRPWWLVGSGTGKEQPVAALDQRYGMVCAAVSRRPGWSAWLPDRSHPCRTTARRTSDEAATARSRASTAPDETRCETSDRLAELASVGARPAPVTTNHPEPGGGQARRVVRLVDGCHRVSVLRWVVWESRALYTAEHPFLESACEQACAHRQAIGPWASTLECCFWEETATPAEWPGRIGQAAQAGAGRSIRAGNDRRAAGRLGIAAGAEAVVATGPGVGTELAPDVVGIGGNDDHLVGESRGVAARRPRKRPLMARTSFKVVVVP